MNNKLSAVRASGFSLVELMIAMALSLILMGGVIGIFISSRQAYQTEDAMSRNQEAGRFSLGVLSPHIRSAGYTGCVNLNGNTPNVIAKPPPDEGFSIGTSVIGYEGGSSNAIRNTGIQWKQKQNNWLPNTDVLVISNGGGCAADLTKDMDAVTDDINIQISSDNNCNFKSGEALLITDCEAVDLFRATKVTTAGVISHAADTENDRANLSRAYKRNATVMKFFQSTYFIGTSQNNNPALFRKDLDGTSEELIDNVANMQIRYGVDTGVRDGKVDEYQTANSISDWSSVLTVRISLLVRSDNNAISEPQVVTFDGSDINSGNDADRRLRSIFSTTVSLRNRIH
jgi:type IV pilus assembly protein PilW